MTARTRRDEAAADPARWAPTHVTDLDPKAVQQIQGQPPPRGSVSVGPGSRWANPFGTGGDRGARAIAVAQYAVWLAGRAELLAAARTELGGRCVRLVIDQSLGPGNG